MKNRDDIAIDPASYNVAFAGTIGAGVMLVPEHTLGERVAETAIAPTQPDAIHSRRME